MIIGLDISTTTIGYSLFRDNLKLIGLSHINLKNETDLLKKLDIVKSELNGIKTKYEDDNYYVFIEAPLFTTPKNINTTAMLLAFNGMVTAISYVVFENKPTPVTVYNARKFFCPELVKVTHKRDGTIKETLSFGSRDKKHYIWDKVKGLEPQINWVMKRTGKPKDYHYDETDSYIIAYYGYYHFFK